MKTLWALMLGSSVAFGQVWVNPITGASAIVQSMAVDNQQNCFVSGRIYADGDTTDFGATNLGIGPFFGRYSRAGKLLYVQQTDAVRLLAMVGSKLIAVEDTNVFEIRDDGRKVLKTQIQNPDFAITGISACNENSFVVAGYFAGQLTVGGETLSATDTNAWTPFTARLSANGRALWIRELAPTFGISVTGTREGGAYVLTRHQLPEPIGLFGSNYRDVFAVQAFGRRGESIWNSEIPGAYLGVILGIASDRQGNCFISGSFRGEMDIGGTALVNPIGRSAYVVGLAFDGSLLSGWNLAEYSLGEQMATDRKGNWYLGTTFISEGSGYEGGVLRNGDTSSAVSFGGVDTDSFRAMTITPDGCIYVSGHCTSAPALIGSTVLSNGGSFVAKFKLERP